jgi:hypothetical protein
MNPLCIPESVKLENLCGTNRYRLSVCIPANADQCSRFPTKCAANTDSMRVGAIMSVVEVANFVIADVTVRQEAEVILAAGAGSKTGADYG